MSGGRPNILQQINYNDVSSNKGVDERRRTSNSEKDGKNEIKAIVNTNIDRTFKANGLPRLDRKENSKQRTVHTPQPGRDIEEENTTTHMTTYTRATHKIPLPDNTIRKPNFIHKNPHKSLPRIIGGSRKLEKMPKSKLNPMQLDPISEKEGKNPLKLDAQSGIKTTKKSTICRLFNISADKYCVLICLCFAI